MLTNAPFMLNLDCDHYLNNSKAVREAMCFLMDPQIGKKLCYVQFPQRFDGIDRHDRYANRNVVFFDVSLNAAMWLTKGLFSVFNEFFFFMATDQHERPGWHSRASVCWNRLCLQQAGIIRL